MPGRGRIISSNLFRGRAILATQLIGPERGACAAIKVENANASLAINVQKLVGHFINFLFAGLLCGLGGCVKFLIMLSLCQYINIYFLPPFSHLSIQGNWLQSASKNKWKSKWKWKWKCKCHLIFAHQLDMCAHMCACVSVCVHFIYLIFLLFFCVRSKAARKWKLF